MNVLKRDLVRLYGTPDQDELLRFLLLSPYLHAFANDAHLSECIADLMRIHYH